MKTIYLLLKLVYCYFMVYILQKHIKEITNLRTRGKSPLSFHFQNVSPNTLFEHRVKLHYCHVMSLCADRRNHALEIKKKIPIVFSLEGFLCMSHVSYSTDVQSS